MKELLMDYSEFARSLEAAWNRANIQLGKVMLGEPTYGHPLEDELWVLRQELKALLRKLEQSAEVDMPDGWNLDAAVVRASLNVLLEAATEQPPAELRCSYRAEIDFVDGLIGNLFRQRRRPQENEEVLLKFSEMAKDFEDDMGRKKSDSAFRNLLESELGIEPACQSPKAFRLADIESPIFDKWKLRYKP